MAVCFCIVFAHVHLCYRNISSVFASSLLRCSRNIRNGKNGSGIEQQQQQSAAVAAATTAVTAAGTAASTVAVIAAMLLFSATATSTARDSNIDDTTKS